MDFKEANRLVLIFGAIFIFIGLYLIFENSIPTIPTLGPETSLFLVFIIGLITGFHCIAMCGGFVVGYSAKANCQNDNVNETEKKRTSKALSSNHLQYAAGKLLSYTLIGALFGLIGSFFVFTPSIRGITAIFAGLFLLLFGLNQLNIFKQLRAVSIPVPKAITRFVASNRNRGPLAVGLMNGLMIACGPLQAMYIFAASTGSVIEGAKILFVFGLGTLPVMLLFGFFVSFVSKNLTQKILRFSGALVVILGIMLLINGFALAGIAVPFIDNQGPGQISNPGSGTIATGVQEIKMEVNSSGFVPNKVTVKQGVPVKWVINATKLTGCNNEIIVPALGIDKKLVSGIQTIEFTPDKIGTIQFSCWMGMIRGTITVEPNTAAGSQGTGKPVESYSQNQQLPKGCGCGGGGASSCHG